MQPCFKVHSTAVLPMINYQRVQRRRSRHPDIGSVVTMLRSAWLALGGLNCSAALGNVQSSINIGALYLQPALLGACTQCQQHFHHSSSSSAPQQHLEPDVDQLQQQILDRAITHVKSLGWSRASLAAALKDLQLSPASVGIFKRGPSQLVEHFIAQQNTVLEKELQAAQQQYLALPLRQRITAAVRRRLELNAPYMDSWPQVGWNEG